MEEIKLEGSPAQVLAADDEGDDEAVHIHEPPAGADEGDDEEAPAVPEELTPAEREERRQLIRKIGRYKTIFGKELTDITTTGLDSMPLTSLKDLLYAADQPKRLGRRRGICRWLPT